MDDDSWERLGITLVILYILGVVVVVSGIAFVAIHFLMKVW